jgi:hypothetical protein
MMLRGMDEQKDDDGTTMPVCSPNASSANTAVVTHSSRYLEAWDEDGVSDGTEMGESTTPRAG